MSQSHEAPNWLAYYDIMRNSPPRETLTTALALIDDEGQANQERFAIDLGCGTGSDTFELLRRGWRVLAMDGQAEAITEVRKNIPLKAQAYLETRVATFEELAKIALPSAYLVNASFSLPFCHPQSFPALWEKIVAALPPGGYFAGQLFGPNDTWASRPNMNFHSRAQVMTLLEPFVVEQCREEENDGSTATGGQKHWHVFWIVARKRD